MKTTLLSSPNCDSANCFFFRAMAKDLHVVLFPWSAFGHLMPFFQLSIALAKAKVHVSLISTPKNLQRLPPVPPALAPFIALVPISMPKIDGDPLPEGAEATVDVPFDMIPYLKLALDLAKQPFKEFIADHSPDWMIVDFNATWICEISREFRIPIVFFRVLSPGFLAFFANVLGKGLPLTEVESLTSPPEIDGVESTVAYRRHEAAAMRAGFFAKNASGMSDRDRVSKILAASRAIVVRSCNEFDSEYLNFYAKFCGKPVIPLGLLPPEKPQKSEFSSDSPWNSTFEWLNSQNPRSVVFVGFGSECKLTRDQVYKIAHGLELSELPFLWALRKPTWAADDSDALPPGFSERTSARGIVSMGWAPQMEILAHPSIGGSLFHAGWGSAIEALQFGHCLILLPFIIDQPLNARLLVEKGVAVEVERNEDGGFSGEAMAKALRNAMVSEEGEEMRRQAREAAAIFGDVKLHERYIDRFVQFLRNGNSN